MDHMNMHGLSYGTVEEYEYRLGLYQEKDAIINEINADPNNTFPVGHNKFSTVNEDEMKGYLGYYGQASDVLDESKIEWLDESNTPSSIDWRTKGAVNPVKDQGHCGSCWAFSATSAIESSHFQATGELLNLAEQQQVDCNKNCYGCNGGW